MIPQYLDFLTDYYDIIEDLTPDREFGQKTWLAFFASDTEFQRVILKELDEKQTNLYQLLTCYWNPYFANVICIHRLETFFPDSQNLSHLPFAVAAIEYAGDQSVAEYVTQNGTLSETLALSVVIQLCQALSKLHTAGIVHRDIKPENIILRNADSCSEEISVKLTDFGGAIIQKKHPDSDMDHIPLYADTTVIGTIGYQAPESLAARTTSAADIYSIGCILNYMLTGSEPGIKRYEGKPHLHYLIRKCSNGDPSMRFHSVGELERLCRHFLRNGLTDRIPLIRSIPGYRSHTRWKAVLASCYYMLMVYELIILIRHYPLHNFVATGLCWFIIPFLAIGNAGYVCEYLPEWLRLNNRLFILFRVVLFFICLFIPLLFY